MFQPPNNQDVAGPKLAEQFIESRSLTDVSGQLVHEDAVTAGRPQRVELKGLVLLVGRNPGIAEDHAGRRCGTHGYLLI